MKTAVSIPDDLFKKVERFALETKRTLTDIFSAALREYVALHAPDEVTNAINRAVDDIGDQDDEQVAVFDAQLAQVGAAGPEEDFAPLDQRGRNDHAFHLRLVDRLPLAELAGSADLQPLAGLIAQIGAGRREGGGASRQSREVGDDRAVPR